MLVVILLYASKVISFFFGRSSSRLCFFSNGLFVNERNNQLGVTSTFNVVSFASVHLNAVCGRSGTTFWFAIFGGEVLERVPAIAIITHITKFDTRVAVRVMSLEADLLDAAELGPLLDEVVLPQAAKVMVANNAAPTVINFFIVFSSSSFYRRSCFGRKNC